MSTEVIKCPACNGVLKVDGTSEYVTCEHCGNTIHITFKKNDRTVFVDKSTGYTLGSVLMPQGYQSTCMIIPNLSTYAYPIEVSCSVFNNKGTIYTYFTGEGFCDVSKAPMVKSIYAQGVNQINRVVYKDFMEGEAYIDNYVRNYAQKNPLKFIKDRPFPIDNYSNDEEVNKYRTQIEMDLRAKGGMSPNILGYYIDPVCREYEMEMNGQTFVIVCATSLKACKYNIGMASALGGLSGLFGKKKKEAPTNSFAPNKINDVVDWAGDGVYMMQCLKGNEEEAFKHFVIFCSTYKVDDGILARSKDMQRQIDANINSYTQNNIRQQQQNFQAWQQINASRQAAFDAKNQAWWDNSNAHHSSVMSSGSSSSSYSSADKFSEAMRGVNTYVREDGSEVEVSVAYDHAYTNNLNDTFATNSSFEPGGNWTEMHKK